MASAWPGGCGPGLLATALAGWASAYYFPNNPPGSSIFSWDDAIRLAVFLMVSLLISSLTSLRKRAQVALQRSLEGLEQRVQQRTAELRASNALRDSGNLRGFAQVTRDITELRNLEREVLQISESQQRRIGHDLHDGLGQELTGVALLAQDLATRLVIRSAPEASEAQRIVTL